MAVVFGTSSKGKVTVIYRNFEYVNSFAADFLAPSAGKNIYVREIKLQTLTFVNRAIPVTNGTEGVLSTLVANGSETVSTTVAIGSERVKLQSTKRRVSV